MTPETNEMPSQTRRKMMQIGVVAVVLIVIGGGLTWLFLPSSTAKGIDKLPTFDTILSEQIPLMTNQWYRVIGLDRPNEIKTSGAFVDVLIDIVNNGYPEASTEAIAEQQSYLKLHETGVLMSIAGIDTRNFNKTPFNPKSADILFLYGADLPIHFVQFDRKLAVLFTHVTTKNIYNTLKLSQKQRAARVLESIVLPIVPELIYTFHRKEQAELGGIAIVYGSRNFLTEEKFDARPEVLCLLFTREAGWAYKEKKITDQELLDQSFIFLSDRGVGLEGYSRISVTLE